jgi:REP element-mobilizing transposase RayT
MTKFQDKYRVESTRMQNWYYGWNGKYFVTTITRNRVCYFGKIESEKMILSNIGIIAHVLWHEIKNHAKNIDLDEFVVMPNHIHGILVLKNFDRKTDKRETANNPLNNEKSNSQEEQLSPGQKRFRNQGKNTISSIIGSYKSAVSSYSHQLGFEFGWQDRFHDHLIRDEKEYWRIKNYIKNNPRNWNKDKFGINR